MRKFGNLLILVAMAIFVFPIILGVFVWLGSFLFKCTGFAPTTTLVCAVNSPFVETVLTMTSNLGFISSFYVLYVAVPVGLIGALLRRSDSKNLNPDKDNNLDQTVFTVGRFIVICLTIAIAIIFWWATIIVVLYTSLKRKSIPEGLKETGSFILLKKYTSSKR